MSSQFPPKEGYQSKDVPAFELADRTSQPAYSDSSLEKDSQDTPHLLNEENTGTSSSNPEVTVQQEQMDKEFDKSMEELDADMAKKKIAEHLREINTDMSELTPAGENPPTDNSEAQEESDPENNDMV
jgi:hypothetical protein